MQRLWICWLPYREISLAGNAPYGTGTGIRTSIVRCPSWYCPFFFTNHHLPFIYQFMLCTFDEPQTGNAMVTLRKITGTVIGKVTVPVMLS
jgi:hypothetical protein